VRRLVAELAPGSPATDIGGVMSLNVHLEAAGRVLRVHQPFVTRARLFAQHELRRQLAAQGLLVPPVVAWRGRTVFRCGNRWAELDGYVPGERLPHALGSYAWLFEQVGVLHRAFAPLDLPVPRPLAGTYAPPGTVRRWLTVTRAAVRHEPEAAARAERLRAMTAARRRQAGAGRRRADARLRLAVRRPVLDHARRADHLAQAPAAPHGAEGRPAAPADRC
jgi:hypothetical protein